MAVELSAEQIRRVLQGISVPPQPQIMVDLQMEQVMPVPDLKAIARLISQDPGLSGALLKLVNSPHFGLANRIASIQQAVNLLGCNSVINLINAQSIKGEMSDETIVTLSRFWDSAQDVAMACLTLAKRIGYQSPDEAYTLGLFHNCGIPLMLKRFPGYMSVLEEAYASTGDGQRIVDIENRVLSTNHAVVGYFTAKSWNLPLHLCDAIANHHPCAMPSPITITRCRCSPTTRGATRRSRRCWRSSRWPSTSAPVIGCWARSRTITSGTACRSWCSNTSGCRNTISSASRKASASLAWADGPAPAC